MESYRLDVPVQAEETEAVSERKESERKEIEIEDAEETIDAPQLIAPGATDLHALMPYLKGMATAYQNSKESKWFTTVDLKNLPLSKLVDSSITSEKKLKEVLVKLKDDKELQHGALKILQTLSKDASELIQESKDDNALIGIAKNLAKQAVRYISAQAYATLGVLSNGLKGFLGISVEDQKKVVAQLVQAVSGTTKVQRVIQILNMCIEAKDNHGTEFDFDKAISSIQEIQEKHAPSENRYSWSTLRRLALGKDQVFECQFYWFCQATITLVKNIQNTKKISQAPASLSTIARSPSAESLMKRNSENKVEVADPCDEKIARLERELAEAQLTIKKNEEKAAELKSTYEKNLQENNEVVKHYKKMSDDDKRDAKDKDIANETLRGEIRDHKSTIAHLELKIADEFKRGQASKEPEIKQKDEISQSKDSRHTHMEKMNSAGILGGFFMVTAGNAAAICYVGMVGGVWVLAPLALFVGGAYYAWNYFSERAEVNKHDSQVKKGNLELKLKWVAAQYETKENEVKRPEGIEVKNQEGADVKHIAPEQTSRISVSLQALVDSVNAPSVTSQRKQKIYGAFHDALLEAESNNESIEDLKARLRGVITPLRGGGGPWFFGKAEHRAVNLAFDTFALAVAPAADPVVRAPSRATK